ncbi:MAG TPA: hypothetical protein VG944_06035 [Fimbriimonas sp.]|nr:hypothetical protein [Fimbriimonas sp.]
MLREWEPMDDAYLKLGELLLAAQAITQSQLETALQIQKQTKRRLGEVLISQGFVDEDRIASCLARQYGYEVVDPAGLEPSDDALDTISAETAAQHRILPISFTDDELYCIVADPLNLPITDDLRLRYKRPVRLAVAGEARLFKAIQEYYRVGGPQKRAEAISLPLRYTKPLSRGEYDGLLCLTATDTAFGRTVTVFRANQGSEAAEAHVELAQRTARASDTDFAFVFDSVNDETYSWTVTEELKGEQLAAVLRFKGKRSPAEAADIVKFVAECAAKFEIGSAKWICPENVWMDKGEVRIAPFIPAPAAYQVDSVVEGLGSLLWHCLIGSFSGRFDFDMEAFRMVPAGMVSILQRCLSYGNGERFTGPLEVAQALGSYRWLETTEEPVTPRATLDREELLATLRVVTPAKKPTFWQKLFRGQAA